jgi:hypothetical protein
LYKGTKKYWEKQAFLLKNVTKSNTISLQVLASDTARSKCLQNALKISIFALSKGNSGSAQAGAE